MSHWEDVKQLTLVSMCPGTEQELANGSKDKGKIPHGMAGNAHVSGYYGKSLGEPRSQPRIYLASPLAVSIHRR